MERKKIANIYENNGQYTLDLFGEIGESWWSDTVAFKNFIKQLDDHKDVELTINIDSVGGDVFDGNAIANAIKSRTKKTTCNIFSICASIATQIALACDEVNMYSNSLFMIHLASAGIYGNKNELQKTIELLDKVDNNLAETYVNKTGLDKEQVLELMTNETWFTAQECLEYGFIDNIIDSVELVARHDTDLSKYKNQYKNMPLEKLKNIKTIKDIEKEKQEKINNEIDMELELIRIKSNL